MRLLLSSIIAALLLALAPPATAAESAVMSDHRARVYFLVTLCEGHGKIEQFNRQVFRGRDQVTYAEIQRRLPELRRAAGRLVPVLAQAAQGYAHPPRLWPAPIRGDMRRIVAAVRDQTYHLRQMSRARSGRAWGVSYKATATAGRHAKKNDVAARRYLDIPIRNGRACR